jgi:hypothetical protein
MSFAKYEKIDGTGFRPEIVGNSVTNNSVGLITAKDNGAFASGASGTVVNSGSIMAAAGTGVDLEADGIVTKNASSSINGGSFGVFVGGGADSLSNSGSIAGGLDRWRSVHSRRHAQQRGRCVNHRWQKRQASSVTNSGTITANDGAGIDLAGRAAASTR